MSLFVLPKSLRSGTDLISKAIIHDPKIINIITTTLSNTQNDYIVGNPEWDNGTRLDVVLEAKSSVLDLPPVIIEIQHTINSLFIKRVINYSLEAFNRHKLDPIVLQKLRFSKISRADKVVKFDAIMKDVHPNNEIKTYFIGIKEILTQRNLFGGQNRYCNNVETSNHECCAVHLLGSQPVFIEQKSILAEAIEEAGHIFELYPRHHCECNPIERFWGASKKIARRNCNYNFRSLDNNINSFLDSVNQPGEIPLQIRRYFNKSFRYIEAYSNEKDVAEAFSLVKDFSKLQKSHRKLCENQKKGVGIVIPQK